MNVFQFASRGGTSYTVDPTTVSGRIRHFKSTGTLYQSVDNTGSLATANDDPVGCWVDGVGGYPNRLTATNATSQRPIYKTGGPAGRPYLALSTTQSMIESFTCNYPMTRIDVIRVKSVGFVTGNYLIGGYQMENGLLQPYPAGRIRIFAGSVPLPLDTWLVIAQVYNEGSSVLNVNGTEASGSVGAGTNPSGLQLNNITYPEPFDILETIVFNVAVSAYDRIGMVNYLKVDYGV
jgi:hypothetical protein